MLYVCFTYTADLPLLSLSSARIRELDPEAIIYAVEDAGAPLGASVPGVRILRSPAPRNGNLNGLAQLSAELHAFCGLMNRHGADYIVKFDADTWCNDLGPFLQTRPVNGRPVPDYLAAENWQAFRPSGNIYRVSRWLVKRLLAMYEARTHCREWPPSYSYPEDVSVWGMACLTRLPLELIPFTSGFSTGMQDGGPGTNEACATAGVVHCGEPVSSGERASREHVALRMRLLKFEIESKMYGQN